MKEEIKIHFKMYKVGRKWVVTGITAASLGLVAIPMMALNAQADTVQVASETAADTGSAVSTTATSQVIGTPANATSAVSSASQPAVVADSSTSATSQMSSSSATVVTGTQPVSAASTAVSSSSSVQPRVTRIEPSRAVVSASAAASATSDSNQTQVSYQSLVQQLSSEKRLAADAAALTHVTKDNFLEYFSLNGSATYDPATGIVTLTKNENNLIGNFSLKNKIDMNTSFTLVGGINIGDKTSAQGGADGIGFAFHNGNTTDIGNAGGNLGIGGLLDAIGFKLDTWHNDSSKPKAAVDGAQIDSTDPDGFGWGQDPQGMSQFGAFVTTSDQQVVATDGNAYQRWWATTDQSSAQRLSASDLNGQFHNFVVSYDGSTRMLTIKYTETWGNVLTWSMTVPNAYQAMAMIMSASTGGAKNLQQFQIDSFDFQQAATVNVKYVDTAGQQLAQGEVTYPNGADVNGTYITDQLEIPGYQFLRMAKDSLAPSGTLKTTGDNGTVIYVYAPAYSVTTKTVNETIHYVDQQAKSVVTSHDAQPVTFITVHNPITDTDTVYYSTTDTTVTLDENGVPTSKAWTQGNSAIFTAVQNPDVTGYKIISTDAPNSDLTRVAVQPVDFTSDDLVYTVVYAPDYSVTTKTVNETVHYVDQQGKTVTQNYQAQPITFLTVHNPVDNSETVYYSTTTSDTTLDENGVPVAGGWTKATSTTFTSVTNPIIAGYKVISNDAPNSDLTYVAVQPVDSTSDDLVYTVVYAPDYSVTTKTVNETVHYVDQQGKTVTQNYQAQPITFLTVHNPVDNSETVYYSTTTSDTTLDENGVPVAGGWTKATSAAFTSVTNPTIAGYKVISNDAPNSDLTQVTMQPVDSTSDNLVYTVVYGPNDPVAPEEPDNPVTPSDPATPTNPTKPVTPTMPQQPSEPEKPSNLTPKQTTNSGKTPFHTTKSNGVTITAGSKETKASQLPQTSDAQSPILALLGTALLSVVTLLGLRRKRH